MPAPAVAAVSTRLATLADLERLHQVIQIAYRSDSNWTNESELVEGERIPIDELAEQIRAQIDPILVADVDGYVAGCIQVEFCRNHPALELPDDTALFGLLAVHSDYQSKGVGKTLFAAGVDYAKTVGKCRKGMMFMINKRTELLAWYERLGFVWNGAKRDFVYPDKALQDDIWFKVLEKDI